MPNLTDRYLKTLERLALEGNPIMLDASELAHLVGAELAARSLIRETVRCNGHVSAKYYTSWIAMYDGGTGREEKKL